MFPTEVSKAFASKNSVVIEGIVMPRSICEMKLKESWHRSATSFSVKTELFAPGSQGAETTATTSSGNAFIVKAPRL